MILPLAAEAPTAGGAALSDVLTASAIASVYFAFTGWIPSRRKSCCKCIASPCSTRTLG